MGQFNLLDKITHMDKGEIRASRSLTLGEDYLADHFPGFPVMPGVLMLEAMVQAAAWLIRGNSDFAHSMVVLKEARNIKYASFLTPGDTLDITATLLKTDGDLYRFKCTGTCDGRKIVSGRITLKAYNLEDTDPSLADTDRYMIGKLTEKFNLLNRGNE